MNNRKLLGTRRRLALGGPALIVLVLAGWMLPASGEAGCLVKYIRAVNDCAQLGMFWERSVCGIDAGLEFAGCVRRTVGG